MEFVYPLKTRMVSVTGNYCSLNCAHCGGHFLEHMIPIDDFHPDGKVKSILISGGCDKNGSVPVLDHKMKILSLKKQYRIVAHTGLLPPKKAPDLKGLADVVSFDMPPSTSSIKDILLLNKKKDDYFKSLIALSKHVPTVPHMTIGLLKGKLNGEIDTLERINSLGIQKIVLNIFIPVPDTIYSRSKPPLIKDVVKVMKNARELFDHINLGCMRPVGKYRDAIDVAALEFTDSIVMPSKKAEKLSLHAKVFYECCALDRG